MGEQPRCRSMNYYEREGAKHLDGSGIFQTTEDRQAESAVATEIEKKWGCQLKRFGALAPIDWYGMRLDRVVGVLELKSRSHESMKYPTVFLNVRKWLALTLASIGLGVPAIFVVKFTDCVLWVPIREVNASAVKVAGCTRRVKADNDIEPLIEVSIASMRPL